VDDAFTYVAEMEDGFAGYCFVAAPARDSDLGPDVAELVAMYVSPDHWRAGAGTALMKAALQRLASLPYREAVLWTFKANERAIAFYERHGWRSDDTEKLHARSGRLAVRYVRSIQDAWRPQQ
jgi:GNAT superfamily N-acetyltransferase